MSKNTVIKIVSIVACALLVAGIVLLVCLLPKGGKTQQIELQLFTAESAENITASTEKGSVKFLNSSGEEISSTLNETTYSLTISQNEKITLNFNANTGYGFAGLYSTPNFETNSLITNNPSYELNTENQPTKLFAKFGKLENLTLEIQTTERGTTEQISKTFPITICLTSEEVLPIIEENFPTAKSLYTAENKCIGMTENTNPSKTFVFNTSSILKIQPSELDSVGSSATITFDAQGGSVSTYKTGSEIGTGLSSVTMPSGRSVPTYQGNTISLVNGNNYLLVFDYYGSASQTFNVDFYPDTLPEITPTAKTSSQTQCWYTKMNHSNASSCRIRFFNNVVNPTTANVYISNIHLYNVSVVTGETGTRLYGINSAYGTLPTPTTRAGYTFAGWWTSATDGTQVSSSTIVTASTTLYAHWTPNVYKITLDKQAATTAGTTEIYEWREIGYYKENDCTTTVTSITKPTMTGATFGGYYTEVGGGGTQCIDESGGITASNTTFSVDTTLYAKWIVPITLNNQSATTAGTETIYELYNNGYYKESGCTNKMSTSANEITVPTMTGATFGGYYTAVGGEGTQYIDASGKLTSSASITNFSAAGSLYAKWTVPITLNNQSATTAGTETIYELYNNGYYKESGCTTKMSTSANPISVPAKTGCTFCGYYTAVAGGGTQYIDANGKLTSSASITNFSANGSLYAKWDLTITLNNQSATLPGTTSTTATFVASMPSISVPTKTGFAFGGYFTATGGGGTQYYTSTGTSAKNCDFATATTLYAKWTIVMNGGSGTLETPYLIGNIDQLNNLSTYVDLGFNCSGKSFKLTADIGSASSPVSWTLPIGTTAENPFDGNFDGNGYKITYNYNSETYQYAGLFGYYTGSSIQNLGVGGTMNNSHASGYVGSLVGYVKNPLTLTNCYNTGSVKAISFAGGLVGYADSTITITNSYNTGSIASSSYGGGLVGQGKSTATITNCYSIGSISGSSVYKGGLIGQCETINIDNGYYPDTCGAGGDGTKLNFANASLLNSSISNMLEKLNIYVIYSSADLGYKYWKISTGQNNGFPVFSDTLSNYTVTFNVNGGVGGPDQETYTHHTAFTIPDVAPMKDGCSFVCWNDQANGKGTSYYPNRSYILTSNKTLYAIYVESGGGGDVTIQLCANGGEFANAQEQTIKSRDVGGIVTLERPTRNGFRFLGYNTKADGSGTDITTMKVSEDISLFAQWEPMEYYVKYYDGTTLLKTDTIPANQQKALSSWTAMKTGQTTAEANNWVFYGWATSNSSFERAYENLAIIENITTFGETINLYAIYSKVLTVNYDGNQATSGSVEEDKSQTIYLSASKTMSNYSVTLKANEFARTNYHFSKWAFGSATGTQFDVGDSFTQANSSLNWNNDSTFTKTFYAIWAGNSYTINYYNGTTKAGTENYIYGENSTLKTFASLNQTIFNQLYGWKFSGWAIANNSIAKTFNDGANITNINIGSEITQNKVIDIYAIYERTIAFHSGKNCATNSTATQTWNPYNTNASNISSVEAPVPTSLKEEKWITLGYRTDQSAGLATYAVTTTTTITPAVDTLNDLYAVYSKEVTITLADKTTTTTTYYNTSGDQTEITTIS